MGTTLTLSVPWQSQAVLGGRGVGAVLAGCPGSLVRKEWHRAPAPNWRLRVALPLPDELSETFYRQ